MENYLNLMKEVLMDGEWKEPARTGMPRTKELFCRTLEFNLQEGFPLLTTKKMFFKGVVAELLWFLRGGTNIKYLVQEGCTIWNDDAYRYYRGIGGVLTKEEWLDHVLNYPHEALCNPKEINLTVDVYYYGDCGAIYGKQWRNFGGYLDQVANLVQNIKQNPNSRYHLLSAWNPMEVLDTKRTALPPCHLMFQCSVREGKYLDMMMLQRSCDLFLGVPFNIASYALLTHLIAMECGLLPGVFSWVGNSVHLYENHLDAVNTQLDREPYKLCKLSVDYKPTFSYDVADIKVEEYMSHERIKAPLSVGI